MAFDIKAAQALMLNEEFNRKVDNVIAAKSQGKKSVASQFSIPATMMQGAIMIIVIAGDFFQRYRFVFAEKGGKAS